MGSNIIFIIPKTVKKANFLGKNFDGLRVFQTSSGYTNDEVHSEWCEFLVEELKEMRGDPAHWMLFIFDGHACHCLNPQ